MWLTYIIFSVTLIKLNLKRYFLQDVMLNMFLRGVITMEARFFAANFKSYKFWHCIGYTTYFFCQNQILAKFRVNRFAGSKVMEKSQFWKHRQLHTR